jgi:hypothetical protein
VPDREEPEHTMKFKSDAPTVLSVESEFSAARIAVAATGAKLNELKVVSTVSPNVTSYRLPKMRT